MLSLENPNLNHIWLQIDINIRNDIKHNLLSTLITQDKFARKSASDAISFITIIVNIF
jgi:hypothetical protein